MLKTRRNSQRNSQNVQATKQLQKRESTFRPINKIKEIRHFVLLRKINATSNQQPASREPPFRSVKENQAISKSAHPSRLCQCQCSVQLLHRLQKLGLGIGNVQLGLPQFLVGI